MSRTVPPGPSGNLNDSREPSEAEQAVIAWQKGFITLDACLPVIQSTVRAIAKRCRIDTCDYMDTGEAFERILSRRPSAS